MESQIDREELIEKLYDEGDDLEGAFDYLFSFAEYLGDFALTGYREKYLRIRDSFEQGVVNSENYTIEINVIRKNLIVYLDGVLFPTERRSEKSLQKNILAVVLSVVGLAWLSLAGGLSHFNGFKAFGVVTLARVILVSCLFLFPLARMVETSISTNDLVRFGLLPKKVTALYGFDKILGGRFDLLRLLKTSLVSLPLMFSVAWVASYNGIFPEDWIEEGGVIGWLAYLMCGVVIGGFSSFKTRFILEQFAPNISSTVRIIIFLALDVIITISILTVVLTLSLWIWWNYVEGLSYTVTEIIYFLKDNYAIYLPLAGAAFAPCLVLLFIMIYKNYGFVRSELRSYASERFDFFTFPLIIPLINFFVSSALVLIVLSLLLILIELFTR